VLQVPELPRDVLDGDGELELVGIADRVDDGDHGGEVGLVPEEAEREAGNGGSSRDVHSTCWIPRFMAARFADWS
jgi:hypothetical protein